MNAVPHGVSGVSGRPFPTPFADPPGEGLSSPTLNVLWSALNVAGAAGILHRPHGTRRPDLTAPAPESETCNGFG